MLKTLSKIIISSLIIDKYNNLRNRIILNTLKILYDEDKK